MSGNDQNELFSPRDNHTPQHHDNTTPQGKRAPNRSRSRNHGHSRPQTRGDGDVSSNVERYRVDQKQARTNPTQPAKPPPPANPPPPVACGTNDIPGSSPRARKFLDSTIKDWAATRTTLVIKTNHGQVLLCGSRKSYEQAIAEGRVAFAPLELATIAAAADGERGSMQDAVAKMIEAKQTFPGARVEDLVDIATGQLTTERNANDDVNDDASG